MDGDLTVDANMSVILGGNAQAQNIFWQVAGEAVLGAGAHFEGVILSKNAIIIGTGASMNGIAGYYQVLGAAPFRTAEIL